MTFTPKKPMLADPIENEKDWAKIKYPVYVSPKLDGLRCIVDEDGLPYSRKGERFANPVLTQLFEIAKEKGHDFSNLDGELGMGSPVQKNFFSQTSGWARRVTGGDVFPEPLDFWVFDRMGPGTFEDRFWKFAPGYDGIVAEITENFRVRVVPQYMCMSAEEVLVYESQFVEQGYEGLMMRGALATAEYKHGRASVNSQQLLKVKRFEDTEGEIVGFEAANENQNEAEKDAFGRTKRSGKKDGLVAIDRVGVILVKCPKFEEIVKIGTGIGLTHDLKDDMWANQDKYIGRTITFTYQGGSDYVKPRFPSFKGWREEGY